MTGSKPRLTVIKKRRALSRRLPRDFASLIHQYAARTGVALWAWNTLHANLFVMFWFLIGRRQDSTLEMAHGVWHTIQNDSTQREMLWQAAVAELAQKPQLLARIEWLLEKSNKLAAYRNIAAHTPAIFSRYVRAALDPIAAVPRASPNRLRWVDSGHWDRAPDPHLAP